MKDWKDKYKPRYTLEIVRVIVACRFVFQCFSQLRRLQSRKFQRNFLNVLRLKEFFVKTSAPTSQVRLGVTIEIATGCSSILWVRNSKPFGVASSLFPLL